MLHLYLSALRELGKGQKDPVEVGQVVEHGRLEQVCLPDHEVVPTHLQKELNVLVAQELQKGTEITNVIVGGWLNERTHSHLSHLRLPVEVPLLETCGIEEID